MEKTLFFLDYANINATARRHGDLDYRRLSDYIGEGRNLVESFAYVPIDPRAVSANDHKIEALWRGGYLVHTKTGTIAGDTYKCNLDVEMAIDILAAAYDIRPQIIVLGSGDSDLLPVVKKLRRMGIRVEIAAFRENVANKLCRQSSGFIDLGELFIEEAAAGQNFGENEEIYHEDGDYDQDPGVMEQHPQGGGMPNAANFG